MKRFLCIAVSLLLSLSVLSADNFLTITDSRDRIVTLDYEPQRVISLAPSVTETIFALGAGNKLVGRTDYCNYPPETSSVTSIGTLYTPSTEKIVELNPDIIIVSTHFKKELLEKFNTLNIKVIIVDEQGSIDGVYSNINKIASITNRTDEAKILIDEMKAKILSVKNRVKDVTKPTVYYVIGYGEYGDYTAGGDTFISDLIELAGGINIAKDSKGWAYSVEKVMEKNPDLLICSMYYNTKEGLEKANGYSVLPAVKKGNIYTIDNNLIDIQGPRLAEGLEALANILHPEGK